MDVTRFGRCVCARLALLASLAFFLASCAAIDQGLMQLSNGVSSADPVTGQRQINLTGEASEISSAEEFTKGFLAEARSKGAKIDSENPQFELVQRVFMRLKSVVHRKDLPWEVHLIDSPEWNAFTVGGGKMFVYTGIFQGDAKISSEGEFAAVLAHEMAHVAARHSAEKRGKLAVAHLVDKGLKKNQGFEPSFTTNQEAEADKYSALYLALAGYEPSVAVDVWKRMHVSGGSYTGNMQYDHPLNDDRAKNMARNASIVQKYLVSGSINPNHESILKNNDLYSYSAVTTAKAGEGGGVASMIELAANSYSEALAAKLEQKNRKMKQALQESQAAGRIRFESLQVSPAQGGGIGIFGYAINAINVPILQSVFAVEYFSGGVLIARDDVQFSALQVGERKALGIPVKAIKYESVTLRPVYAQIAGE